MIRNESEYKEAVGRLAEERKRLAEHRARLKEAGLSDEEIKRVIDPMESFHLQLKEEVESYERLKRQEFDELDNLRGLGHLLISVRIAQGMSQRELAKRLGVHESQVSRDERNEYFGITLERAVKVLHAERPASDEGRNRRIRGKRLRCERRMKDADFSIRQIELNRSTELLLSRRVHHEVDRASTDPQSPCNLSVAESLPEQAFGSSAWRVAVCGRPCDSPFWRPCAMLQNARGD